MPTNDLPAIISDKEVASAIMALPAEKQQEIISMLAQSKIDLSKEAILRQLKSTNSKRDTEMFIGAVDSLTRSGETNINAKLDTETGSGRISIEVKKRGKFGIF